MRRLAVILDGGDSARVVMQLIDPQRALGYRFSAFGRWWEITALRTAQRTFVATPVPCDSTQH